MLNALTIDVEEYFPAHAYEHVIDRARWDELPSRVAVNTRRVLDVLRAHATHATFFVLGWVAERHPDLVRENLSWPMAFSALQSNIPGLSDTTDFTHNNPPVAGPAFYRIGVHP